MTNQQNGTRRNFLKKAAGIGAGAAVFPFIIPASALGQAGSKPASDRITVGCIGVGPQGRGVMRGFLGSKDAQVIAVCDVKTSAREAAKRQVQQRYKTAQCDTYNDFRDLLDRKDRHSRGRRAVAQTTIRQLPA